MYLTYLKTSNLFLMICPSEAHATAGRRPAVARSERSERSVREALLRLAPQKICPTYGPHQKKNMSLFQMLLNWGTTKKNISHILTKSKKKNVPCQNVAQLRYNKKNMSLVQILLNWVKTKKNMSNVIVAHLVTFSNFCD